ncbi:MAG: DNA-directed RNA polymerase subunit beta' [bacterium]|nr:DNA-directed RNA polymerase subunit beta' [bacterium]
MNPLPENNIDFDAIKLILASPEQVTHWSNGEITKPETINYRTQRPEKDGLFCEKIFGPTKDWQCYCGKYKGVRYKGIVCDKCGVLITRNLIRRERMGHIKLAVPVTHIWFLRGTPSSIGVILNMSIRDLERIAYFANYVVTQVDEQVRKKVISDLQSDFKNRRSEIIKDKKGRKTKEQDSQDIQAQLAELQENFDLAKSELKELNKYQLLSEARYRELNIKYGEVFKAGIGAEALAYLLSEINLKKLSKDLKNEITNSIGQKQKKAVKRLKVVEGMVASNVRPEWMIMTVMPVIPPDLRPMVQLDGGRFAASDLNDLYRRVINRNNRLKKLYELEAPEVICRNEKRMLQEAVDALIDNNARRDRAVSGAGTRKKLKSLTDLLKGKQGRFRQNLLGKRVDYSGRSVIVIGPYLKLDQCGVPKMMALELFKPFVIGKLIALGYAHNVKSASRMIERERNEVWDALDEVIKDKYVLLNRAPTLHRLGIQAFKPVLIEGKAIQLHPMVCYAFAADFDGDQMAVHVPLSEASQTEAREIMLSTVNLLKPSSGEPVVNPDQDIVLGCYYLTNIKERLQGEAKVFTDPDEAIYAYQNNNIDLQAKIKVRIGGELIETSAGRLLFNEVLPEDIGFKNETLNKSALKAVMAEVFVKHGNEITASFADNIKDLGFRYATKSGVSIGINDWQSPPNKKKIIDEGEAKVVEYLNQYEQGLITDKERYERTTEVWQKVSEAVEKELTESLNPEKSTIAMIIQSGARGTASQANQMAGMKGLVLNPTGRIIELPIRSNYKEGLSVLEFFISTHGARKGLTDTALKTAESGYLTRRLVDVAQDVVISEQDCGDKEGFLLTKKEALLVGEESLASWIVGRISAQKVIDPKTKKVLVNKNELITDQIAKQIADSNIEEFRIRSIFKCLTRWGICQKCYGIDLAKGTLVNLGEAVGIMAAQSIGEPGTQLTMKTFHLGGVAGTDITQGLPRVEEIFEARSPKGESILSEIDGVISIKESNNKKVIRISQPNLKVTDYKLEKMKPLVKSGATVKKGQLLASSEDKKRTIKAGAEGSVKINSTSIGLTHEGGNMREYTISAYKGLEVKNGDLVTVGQKLTEGSINLQDMLKLLGKEVVQRYIIDEVQAIYSSQGQTIASKHIEVIVKQMFSKVRIISPMDTNLLDGDIVSKLILEEENQKAAKAKKKPATFEENLLSITKVSTTSDSWLSAASFQETTKVLINAALRGKKDKLRGLKENVIIGRLIPVGTGFREMEG